MEREDRLSNLPDCLLILILSHLPINTAASTSVLSRRWKHLWNHVTNFTFKITTNNLQNFITLIDRILSQLTSPTIRTLNLQISVRQSTNSKIISSCFVPWFHQICRRNPEVISVSFYHSHRFYYSPLLFQIPGFVFQTSSLIELVLFLPALIVFDAPESFINLPNLKKLHLLVYDSYCDLMDTLLKSLPNLEELKLGMNLTRDIHCLTISSSNLKCLFIRMDDWESKVSRFVIDAPKLEQFEIHGYLAFYEFVKIPMNLEKVVILIKEPSDDDDDFDKDYEYYSLIHGLFQGIYCVRSLDFISYGADFLSYLNGLDGIEVPIFRNLMDFSFYNDYRPYEGPITRLLLRQH